MTIFNTLFFNVKGDKCHKTCKFNPCLYKMLSSGQLVKRRDIILLRRFCRYLMIVFEQIIILFKRPCIPGKNEEDD